MMSSSSVQLFGDRLVAAILRRRSHVVVGLDPHLELIPQQLQDGLDPGDPRTFAEVISRFSIGVLDAVSDLVPAVKLQVAFYERFGAAGFAALQQVVTEARQRGLLVISDAKRGDIASTAAAYAECHIGFFRDSRGREHRILDADAVTVNAYLGSDSLVPFVKFVEHGKGVFVLAKTSNPSSAELQDRTILTRKGDKPLFEAVADMVDDLASVVDRSLWNLIWRFSR